MTFIAFEGVSCSGKTTQIEMLADHLTDNLLDVTVTSEPYQPHFKEFIVNTPFKYVESELLVMLAQRFQHFKDVIEPSINQGKIVLCDRFIDSTLVYQGMAKGLRSSFIKLLHRTVLPYNKYFYNPDWTIYLDITYETFLHRQQKRDRTRTLKDTLHEMNFRKIALAFLDLAEKAEKNNTGELFNHYKAFDKHILHDMIRRSPYIKGLVQSHGKNNQTLC